MVNYKDIHFTTGHVREGEEDGHFSAYLRSAAYKLGFKTVFQLYSHYVFKEGDEDKKIKEVTGMQNLRSEFKEAEFREYIDVTLPKDYSGVVKYDFEFPHIWPWVTGWRDWPRTPEKTKESIDRVSAVVKEMRPNCTIAAYGFPVLPGINKFEEDFMGSYERALLYLDGVPDSLDILVPSVYDKTPLESHSKYQILRTYVATLIAKKVTPARVVYPAIHRFFSNSSQNISFEELAQQQIDPSIMAGCDGFIMWGNERWGVDRGYYRSGDFRGFETPEEKKAVIDCQHGELMLQMLRKYPAI